MTDSTARSADLPPLTDPEAHRLAVDAVRVLSMDAVQEADSGHPGTPMALAPLGYVTWTHHLRHNPANPDWLDRDRFVLSVGHASMLLYSMLHLSGYDLDLGEIEDFRQWGSRTPGHPEVHETPGVETTTGPLGQGVANSVGMAMAERWLAHHFNRPGHEIVDHHTWVFCSDGDLMEGISHEAAEFAGHQRLGKLTWIFDDNRITIEGSTDLATSIDMRKRFEAYGWQVLEVDDGNDLAAIDAALAESKAERERPTLIVLRTTIAWGSPGKAGTAASHGAPLGEEEVRATKENLGYPSQEPFHIEEEGLALWRSCQERGRVLESEWDERFATYREEHPELAEQLLAALKGELPEGWEADLPDLSASTNATRSHSGAVLQGLADAIPNWIGGSADLGGSNKTDIDGADSILPATPAGRVLHFGVREHAMASICNGMTLHGGVHPYCGTFLIFSDYMRPAIRLAALMEQPVRYVFTHDSVGLGEDGPTHQPIEQLMALRLIPGLMDLRPADGPETVEAWKAALRRTDGPAFLSLTRQKVPALERGENGLSSAEGLHRGGYVLRRESSGDAPAVVLLASGSEVAVALETSDALESDGVSTRVVSLPSWYLFAGQDAKYRAEVLGPEGALRVSIEAGATQGWERWIGSGGLAVGIDHFGASAPAEILFERFGLTAPSVLRRIRDALESA